MKPNFKLTTLNIQKTDFKTCSAQRQLLVTLGKMLTKNAEQMSTILVKYHTNTKDLSVKSNFKTCSIRMDFQLTLFSKQGSERDRLLRLDQAGGPGVTAV